MLRMSGRPSFRSGLLLSCAFTLCACADLFGPKAPPPVEPQEVKPIQYNASDYIFSLSDAELVLEHGGTVKDVAGDIKVIESYSATKRSKPTTLKLVVLDYSSEKTGAAEKVLVSTGSQGKDTADLAKLTKRLNGYKATLSEVKVMSVPVKTKPMTKLTKLDSKQLLDKISAEQNALLAGAGKLSALDETRIHIELLEFFMARKEKDAAYLCADSAKRLLAKAARRSEDEAETNKLSAELDKLEGKLRQTMPY